MTHNRLLLGRMGSLASSSATRAESAPTRAINVWVSASFCSCESDHQLKAHGFFDVNAVRHLWD